MSESIGYPAVLEGRASIQQPSKIQASGRVQNWYVDRRIVYI